MSQPRNSEIRIVIVDDHRMVRDGIRMLIEGRPGMRVVGEAGSPAEAIPVIERELPDVVLLDLDLRGRSGLDLLSEIKEKSERTRVLVLTGVRDRAVFVQCVRLGTKGLVQKENASEVLLKAIEKVCAGERWFDRAVMDSVLDEVFNHKNGGTVDVEEQKIASLTPREKEVIGLVCEGLKNKEIANRLFISDTTVRHHLTSIFSKLEVSDRLELVIYSFRVGLAKPPK